jgi:RNA-directed DNA polymerase
VRRMRERKAPPARKADQESATWNKLPWRKLEQHVYRIQKRIYRASQRGETRKVEKLQKLVMKSKSARLLAVRRVTQDNQGKKTAGVDGVKSVPPHARCALAERLHPKHCKRNKAKPVRRVWLPKPGKPGERRPLGIPVMAERGQPALVKLALEPAWEAKFEANSYGFRPGRSGHDAIAAVFLAIRFKPKYVFDADIPGAFDHISHEALVEKLHTYPHMRRLIRGWLKAGVMEGMEFSPTESGTPQGGVISPLLMNVALDGMAQAMAAARYTQGQPLLVRSADDFVVCHPDKEELCKAVELVTSWLAHMGLRLNPSKTSITHTLEPCKGNVGCDFLGFPVRQYPVGKCQTGKDPARKPLGFKTSITARKRHSQEIKRLLRKLRSAPQEAVIRALNPLIRGWTNSYKGWICSRLFSNCEYLTFKQLARWEQARHPGKSKHWLRKR